MRERRMYICKKCKCNYDPGELIGGICIDCREKELAQADQGKDMPQSVFRQMDLLTWMRTYKCSRY